MTGTGSGADKSAIAQGGAMAHDGSEAYAMPDDGQDRTELDHLRTIERILYDSQDMVAKAALNAETIRKDNEAFTEAIHKKLGEIHETIKVIGWWACFCFLVLAAIKWPWGDR